jgi:hypothetical protein
MNRLLHSSKFWLLVLDVVISTILFFLTLFMKPDDVVKVMGLIATIQPIFIVIIKAICDEDVAKHEAQGWRASILRPDSKIDEDTPK